MVGMQVPLIAFSFVDENSKKQKLELWTNGTRRFVEPPFDPYIVSKIELPMSGDHKVEKIEGRPLSTLEKIDMYKYSFPNTGAVSKLNKDIEAPENVYLKPLVCDNHTEFRERILIDQPEYFKQFANSRELKLFCLDFETLTYQDEDYFSITSAAWGTDISNVVSRQAPVHWRSANDKNGVTDFGTIDEHLASLETPYGFNEEELNIWKKARIAEFVADKKPFVLPDDESRLLMAFLEALIKADPDVIIGFNHHDFDFIRYFDRCRVFGIDYNKISRTNANVRIGKRRIDFIEFNHIDIPGRVMFDIFYPVRADQSLHGIKRRGLKETAAWMKMPVIKEDTKNTATILQQDLKLYNESDVITTFRLFDVYFLNQMTLAEMFGIPLNMIIDGSPSFLANLFQAPDLHRMGIVSDGMNKERHPEIYDEKYRESVKMQEALNKALAAAENDEDEEDEDDELLDPEEKKDKKKSAYEAAYVAIYRTGFFPKIYKIDYKGMYNAIEITANISPETTKIIKYLPYNKDGFKFQKKGTNTIYFVPDKRIGKTVVILVNNAFDGVLRKKLREIRQTRFAIKQKMETCSPEELPRLESQQYGLKVVANIPSGYNGQGTARWGDAAVSILTVGIGRILIKDTIQYIEAKYGGNEWMLDPSIDVKAIDKSKFKVCIEVDTDGIYISERVDIDDLNNYLAERVKDLIGTEESELQLDFDEYNEGFFSKMKNYILYGKKGNIIIHGGSFKSSRLPRCFDTALERLVPCRLKNEGDPKALIRDILDFDKYALEDFVIGVKLGKDEYTPTSLNGRLVTKASALGIRAKAGTNIDYVKTRGDFEILRTIRSIQEIDKNYYTKTLSKLIIAFGYKEELLSKDTEDISKYVDDAPAAQPDDDTDNWAW